VVGAPPLVMSEFDIVQMHYELSSDEGPTCGDEVSMAAWDAVEGEVLAWLVRPSSRTPTLGRTLSRLAQSVVREVGAVALEKALDE
jgi:hypothetical protein